ncbi:ABC transporter permease [Palleronia pelagia]|uniref:Putative thiamine transport system permease protein n=1 Tax=Palleronia pelagia TaxID=387096 RepID=A0A1H8L6Z5_9RHOB|nr:ABC transporter permease subunit [Palleronia pelagia]SEO00596.1 putative thiamine transport system permease protein [Palleronia pelagia]
MLLAMLGPVAAGLWGALLPAMGHLPAAGFIGPSLEAWSPLGAWPGLGDSIRLSLVTGLLATLISLAIVTLIVAGWWGTRPYNWIERALSPLLSVPHAAAALGLAFLIAPSGWLARLASPGITGWDRPPDWLIPGDPWGLSLTAGLVAKEVPFLLLMTLAALGQVRARAMLISAQAMGYGRIAAWLKVVFPAVYAQIRLPVFVVLAYSMSVVDMALILGPSTPATLSVQIVRWMSDPDLSMRLVASAAALLQLALVLVALAAWRGGEIALRRWGIAWATGGGRGAMLDPLRPLGLGLGGLSALAVLGGIAAMALWSVAAGWRFPDALPEALTARSWMRHADGLGAAVGDTALVALVAVALAVALTVGCLEAEFRRGRPIGRAGIWLLYLPLIVPQTAFLPGLQTLLLRLGADRGALPVIAAHLVFVLPYVFLSLGDPWRAWDTRQATVGAALGASPGRVFLRVRLPMLLRPILVAAAVGAAVSVGQYLPTLLIGGGRVATLTTEAVALASGGDRRAIGVYALAQTGAALLPFALATLLPLALWRNRRGLHG